MNSGFRLLVILILLVTPTSAFQGNNGEQKSPMFDVPKQLTFRFELQGSPDLASKSSWWEVSAQLLVADQEAYMRWLAQRKSGQADTPEPAITLLATKSLRGRNLSAAASNKIEFTVPVGSELLKRFQNIKNTPQVIWISGVARVHSGDGGVEVVNDAVTPFWDLRHFINRDANVKLWLNSKGQLSWSSGNRTTAVPK